MLEDFGTELPVKVKCCNCKKEVPKTACKTLGNHDHICIRCFDEITKMISTPPPGRENEKVPWEEGYVYAPYIPKIRI